MRLRVLVSYLLDDNNVERIGTTEPITVSSRPNRSVDQTRSYPLRPAATARGPPPNVYLSHHLDRDTGARNDDCLGNSAPISGAPYAAAPRGQNGALPASVNINKSGAFDKDLGSKHRSKYKTALVKFIRITDLPVPRYGDPDGRVVAVVEPDDDEGASLGKAGPFETEPQVGGLTRKADCRGTQIFTPVWELGHHGEDVVVFRVLVSYVDENSRHLERIGITGPIEVTPLSQLSDSDHYPLWDHDAEDGHDPVGRIYLAHHLLADGEDARCQSIRDSPPDRQRPSHSSLASAAFGAGAPRGRGPPLLSISVGTLGQWPAEVTKHLATPDHLEQVCDEGALARTSRGGSALPATKNLRLVMGAWQIPHPKAARVGGYESFFMSDGGDGAGVFEIADVNPRFCGNPRAVADAAAQAGKSACDRDKFSAHDRPTDRASVALKMGNQATGSCCSCAAIVASLDSRTGELGAAKFAGPGCWQFRKGHALSNPTRAVGRTGERDSLSDHPSHRTGRERLQTHKFELQEGDLIVLASDGVWDNLLDQEICGLVDWTISPLEAQQVYRESTGALRGGGSHCTDPVDVAAALAHAAHCRARDNSAQTPFSDRAREYGVYHSGGRMDDITVVCAWVARTEGD